MEGWQSISTPVPCWIGWRSKAALMPTKSRYSASQWEPKPPSTPLNPDLSKTKSNGIFVQRSRITHGVGIARFDDRPDLDVCRRQG